MTTLTTPRRFISLLVVLTALCAALAAVSSVGAVDIVFGLPLALFLPGAALVWAIDPWGRQVKGPERLMWSFGSSIGIVILGGLLLNLTGGLTRQHWLILISVGGGRLRRGRLGAKRDSGRARKTPRSPGGGGAGSLGDYPLSPRRGAPRRGRPGCLGGARALCRGRAPSRARSTSCRPGSSPNPQATCTARRPSWASGTRRGALRSLVIRVSVGSSHSSTRTVDLKDGQEWTHQVSRNPGQPVSATVAIASRPSSILDRVDLAKPCMRPRTDLPIRRRSGRRSPSSRYPSCR